MYGRNKCYSAAADNDVAENTIEYTIPEGADFVRLDVQIGEILHAREDAPASREKVKILIKDGTVRVNSDVCRKPARKVGPGDVITFSLDIDPVPGDSVEPQAGELTILYKNQSLVVLDKPPGLTVHPAPSCPEGTLAHILTYHFPELQIIPGLRPGIVHRIDKHTSGLLVVALNEKTRALLSAEFEQRRVDKEYLALVHGIPNPEQGTIEAPLGRHPTQKTKMAVVAKGGRPARSSYRVLYATPDRRFSLLAVKIYTGRTHQIRVHLQYIGVPIVGDGVYGPSGTGAGPAADALAARQMLHAWKLAFADPTGGRRESFTCPPPKDFCRLVLHLSRRLQRVVITGMPGCGKSALTDMLQQHDIPIFKADDAVAELYAPGGDGRSMIVGRFGDQFLQDHPNPDEAPLDKGKLFAAMRDSEVLRREIMEIIHPMVGHRLQEFWQQNAANRIAAAEIPLALEVGGEMIKDTVKVGVYCPQEIRRERLQANRGWDDSVFAAVESWQWPEETKIRACDLVVDNSGTIQELQTKAQGLLHVLAGLRRREMHSLKDRLKELWETQQHVSD